jgi:hypothetical protein
LRDTFRAYVDARIATYRALPTSRMQRPLSPLSKELQGEVWELAVAATQRKDANAGRTIVLMPQLQDMFSARHRPDRRVADPSADRHLRDADRAGAGGGGARRLPGGGRARL